MERSPGQELSHYRLIEPLGAGGMGEVWSAEDVRLGRRVALKFLADEVAQHEEAEKWQLREARSVSALNHPNICSLYDVIDHDGDRCLVFELVIGTTLEQKLRDGPLPVELAVEIARQAAEGLAAAHAVDLVHRDIKPANLALTEARSAGSDALPLVKILDFGLAKTAPRMEGDTSEGTTVVMDELTTPGTVVGTVAYMSPQQARGEPVDERTDLFSLGAVLYEMLTGERAFDGATTAVVFERLLNRDPPRVDQLRSSVSRRLADVVARALSKRVEDRFGSAIEFAEELRAAVDGSGEVQSETADASPEAPRLGAFARLGMAAAMVGVVLAVGLFWIARSSENEGPPGGPAQTPMAWKPMGPTIAVVPFRNASDDPGQTYFAEGLAEDIMAELAQYRELGVIARSATSRYRDREDLNVSELGEVLGARYVLQGSVRRSGDRIRVNVELSDGEDARSLWAEVYQRDLTAGDVFEIQDELTQRVVNSIAGSYGALTRAALPRVRAGSGATLGAYDCILRAYEYLQVHTQENHLAAHDCLMGFRETEYVDALAWLAYLWAELYHHRWDQRDGPEALATARELAERAVRLDETSHVAHGALALTSFFAGDTEQARIQSFRTIELSPNNTTWLSLIGAYLAQAGDFEGGIAMVDRAVALNPHPPSWIRLPILYQAIDEKRWEAMLEEAMEMDLGDDFRGPLFVASALGHLGRRDEAQPHLRDLAALWNRPNDELRRELIERHAISQQLATALLDGLVRAGLELNVAGAGAVRTSNGG